MNYIGKFISNFKDAYNDINSATLTGAIDVVVVRHEDTTYTTSPFHVRFGKIGVLRSKEKVVDIEINGEPVDIRMKLGESGEAFFVEEIEDGEEINFLLGTSPLPSFCFKHDGEDIKSLDSGVEAEEILAKNIDNASRFTLEEKREAKQALDFGGPTEKELRDGEKSTEIIWLDVSQTEKSTQTGHENSQNKVRSSDIESILCYHDGSVGCDKCGKNGARSARSSGDGSGSEQTRSKSLSGNAPKVSSVYDIVPNENRGSKTDGEETIKASRSQRRRRRRRANLRHSKAVESQSSENSTTSDTADINSLQETLFYMENLRDYNIEDPIANLRVSQSLSMPMLAYRCEETERDWIHPMSRSMAHDFHPFSDTDISPPPSPNKSRSETPIKSDTEYEVEKQKSELSKEGCGPEVNWSWGELPTPTTQPRNLTFQRSNSSRRHSSCAELDKSPENEEKETKKQQDKIEAEAAAAQRSMLGSMLSFMRATKKVRHNPELTEGIYLDQLDLEDCDPEVAALYFPRHTNKALANERNKNLGFRPVTKDEDIESGNGTSLPQSPNSVEGALCGGSEYEESSRHPIFDYRGYHDLAFSLCGCLHDYIDGGFPESLFLQSLVTYDDFCENLVMMDSPNLVVRMDGKYMNWATASPQILSLVLFQRPLPKSLAESLEHENMPKKEMRKRTESRGYRWFTWGSKKEDDDVQNTEQESPSTTSTTTTIVASMDDTHVGMLKSSSAECVSTLDQSKTLDRTLSYVQPESLLINTDEKVNSLSLALKSVESDLKTPRIRTDSSCSDDSFDENKKYKKSLRLTSVKIAKLNLKEGMNKVVFSVTTAYQGTTRCECNIFLWNYDDNIIVSDIDGTITKSDVWGHILPIIGKDWAQGGVAQLFTKIKNNGYNFLYLSSRAIGQAHITREYLRSVKQGDVSLPDGPLLLNPTSLLQAFHREVIIKKPEEFKISCLRDIQALFPKHKNPFYAGYGNRVNDVWAYRAVGIPISRIFTINHKGELRHELTQAFQTTYSEQMKVADQTFPPIDRKMVPRNLLCFMYSESESGNDDMVDYDYDSEWEGVPTGLDATAMR